MKIIYICFASFYIYLLFNVIAVSGHFHSIEIVMLWLDAAAVFYILQNVPAAKSNNTLLFFIAVGLILSAVHLVNVLLLDGYRQAPAFLTHAFHFGFMANLFALTAAGMTIESRNKWIRSLAVLTFLLSTVFIFSDIKASPLFGFGFGLFSALAIWESNRIRNRRMFIVVMILIPLIMTVFILHDVLFAELKKQLLSDNVTSGHQIPMMTALKAGIANPALGVGVGRFQDFSGLYEPALVGKWIRRAHNSIFELFAETGFIGLLSASLWIYLILKALLRRRQKTVMTTFVYRGVVAAILAALLLSLMDFGLQIPANVIAMAVLVGVAFHGTDSRHKPDRAFRSVKGMSVIPLVLALLWIPVTISSFYLDQAVNANRIGRINRALKLSQTALRLNPFDDRIDQLMGEIYLKRAAVSGSEDDYHHARRSVEKSLNRNPAQAALHYALASIEYAEENPDNAYIGRHLEAAHKLDPSNPGYSVGYIENLIRMNNEAAAIDHLVAAVNQAHVLQVEGIAGDVYTIWIRNHLDMGSLAFLSHRVSPEKFVLFIRAGIEQGLNTRISQLINQVDDNFFQNLSPEDSLDYTRSAYRAGDRDMALKVIQIAMKKSLQPEQESDFIELKADILYDGENYAEADANYSRAVQLNPKNLHLRIKATECRRKRFGQTAALTGYQDIARDFPNSAKAHFLLARELNADDRKLEALQEFRRARSLTGDEKFNTEVKQVMSELGLNEFWDNDL